MGMVASEVRDAHVTEDRRVRDLEREYTAAGNEAAAWHVHGARVLLEKARRLAEARAVPAWMLN